MQIQLNRHPNIIRVGNIVLLPDCPSVDSTEEKCRPVLIIKTNNHTSLVTVISHSPQKCDLDNDRLLIPYPFSKFLSKVSWIIPRWLVLTHNSPIYNRQSSPIINIGNPLTYEVIHRTDCRIKQKTAVILSHYTRWKY